MYVVKMKGIGRLLKLSNAEYHALKTHPSRKRKIQYKIKI